MTDAQEVAKELYGRVTAPCHYPSEPMDEKEARIALIVEALDAREREVWEKAAKREQMWRGLVELMVVHDCRVALQEYESMEEHNRVVERIRLRKVELLQGKNWCRRQGGGG